MLRCTVSADMLLTPIPTSSFYKNSVQCIVDSDGYILFSNHDENWMGTNLLETLKKNNVSDKSVDLLRPALKEDHNTTVKFKLDHTNYFCSSVSLGYNDWNLVQITKTSAVDAVLHKILKKYRSCQPGSNPINNPYRSLGFPGHHPAAAENSA